MGRAGLVISACFLAFVRLGLLPSVRAVAQHQQAGAGFGTVGELIEAVRLKAALEKAMSIARAANVYLDQKAPWFQIKEDREAAATTVYVI